MNTVIPGLTRNPEVFRKDWIPAFAGMTTWVFLPPYDAPSSTAKIRKSGAHCLSPKTSHGVNDLFGRVAQATLILRATQEISGIGVPFSWVTFFSGS